MILRIREALPDVTIVTGYTLIVCGVGALLGLNGVIVVLGAALVYVGWKAS